MAQHTESTERDKWLKMFIEQEKIDKQIKNDDFDKIYLPSKQALPLQLSHRLEMQALQNPFFMQNLHHKESLKDVYWCHNDKCKKELFYSDGVNAICSKCNTKINTDNIERMQIKMNEYKQSMQDIQTPINEAIETSLKKIISKDIIQTIQEYANLDHVQYYVLQFDGDEYSIQREGHLIPNYIGDKKAVQIALHKIKNELKFGDIVFIDAYGPHFVGFDDQNEPKLIINPCYNGYHQQSCIHTLCVPLEITEQMEDFMAFYRLNFINLFKAEGCGKITYFPVSMASVSYRKLNALKERLASLPDAIFQLDLPDHTVFYLESTNFNYIDEVHIVVYGELYSICIDKTEHERYQIGQQLLSLLIKKMDLQNAINAKMKHK